jgi:bis(5'-nucleosidyl)-tetraphosphatase
LAWLLFAVRFVCRLKSFHRFDSSGENILKDTMSLNIVNKRVEKQSGEFMLNEKSCGAVIFHKKDDLIKYLMLNYEAGHWDFVKGNVEVNESEKETVVRELKEETGITEAQFIDDFREAITYFYRRQGLTVHKEVVFFLMESCTDKVQLSFEHVGYIWLDYRHAMEKLTFKNAKDTLQKAHEFLKKNGIIKPTE